MRMRPWHTRTREIAYQPMEQEWKHQCNHLLGVCLICIYLLHACNFHHVYVGNFIPSHSSIFETWISVVEYEGNITIYEKAYMISKSNYSYQIMATETTTLLITTPIYYYGINSLQEELNRLVGVFNLPQYILKQEAY